jgi:hypothetical protein
MILKNCQESWLVADVSDIFIVEEIEPFDERSWASKCSDQGCLIMRNEALGRSAVFSAEVSDIKYSQ